jgi:non-heme chloroperoxidase
LAAWVAADTAACSARAESFARGVPTARIIRIPNADHYVHRSNEAQVIEEIKKFLSALHSDRFRKLGASGGLK